MTTAEQLREQYGALTSEEVAALDRAAGEAGVTVTQLMEIAGWQVARCAWKLLDERPERVGVVAGRGNNGGDALVAARHLTTWGCTVTTYRIGEDDPDALSQSFARAALVIDGILGTGLRSAPREPPASAVYAINDAGVRVLAIDIPSGMDASSGDVYEPCIRAAVTCTLAALKAGLLNRSAKSHVGDIWVADIGMPAAAWSACGLAQPTAIRGGLLAPIPVTT